jgi:TRAP-type transport system periplasmic protein
VRLLLPANKDFTATRSADFIFWREIMTTKLLMAAAMLTFIATGASAQPQVVVKVGTSIAGDNHPVVITVNRWAQLVKERSRGEIAIQLFPSGQLGGEVEMAEALRLGSLEATANTVTVFSRWIPQAEIFDLPFMFKDDDHALRVYTGAPGEQLAKLFPPHGFRVLGFAIAGVRQPFGAFAVNTPDDVKGKKMRVIQSPLHIAIWKAVGANPTPIPAPEIYNALQTKLVDFADNTKTNYVNQKWSEVAPYFTVLSHVYAIGGMFVSERWWQRLKPEHQKILGDSYQELIPVLHHLIAYQDELSLVQAEKAGTKVTIVRDKEPWRKAMLPIWDEWAAKVPGGKAMIDQILATK